MLKEPVPLRTFTVLLLDIVLLIYSKQEFIDLCESSNLRFHDTQTFNEALFEFIAFGVSLVRVGVNKNASGRIKRNLLRALNEEFRMTIKNGGLSESEVSEIATLLDADIADYESATSADDFAALVVSKILTTLTS